MARKISRDAAAAFFVGTNFKRSNTKVVLDRDYGHVRMYLHGNLIAERGIHTHGVKLRLAGWNTPTTRGRLNAILADDYRDQHFHQKDFTPHVDDIEVSDTQWVYFWGNDQWGFDWDKPVPLAQMLESSK